MRVLLGLGLCFLSACQTVPQNSRTDQVISPALAVMAAADAAPAGFPGTFGFRVMRADFVGPRLFLNSYPDYRDQRNLSIAIEPRAIPALRNAFGQDLKSAFMHHDIRVQGVARRRRIDFTTDGRPTGKYYYQTHVIVTEAEQIRVVG
jgi:hypothetical protein